VQLAKFTACSDSVLAELKKTAAGRKVLAKPPVDGTAFPEVVNACGSPKASAVAGANPVTAINAATKAAAATDAATEAKQAPAAEAPKAPAGPTPEQQALAAKAAEKEKEAEAARAAQRAAMTDSVKTVAAEGARTDSLTKAAEARVVREVFAYGGGARDPFASAVKRKTVGPELVDLTLVGVLEDPRAPNRSVATFRDKRTGKRHSVRQGDQIGRNRVMQIRDKDVVFSVFDFGIERRETLTLRKQEDVTP
jgi:hypothetical protein